MSSSADPFQLDRLAEELVSRETSNNEDTTYELPEYVPLSHDNPYLTAQTFDVEEFLLSRSHTSLQDLKAELRGYLSSLKEELVQLINDDYEAFISLSTDLKGEGDRLSNLKAPLAGLRQEIQISKADLRAIQDAIEEKLKKRAALREEKALLHLLLKISESVLRLETLLLISSAEISEMDGIQPANPNEEPEEREGNRAKHLSRVAAEYTQLLYHANKAQAEKCLFVDEIQWRIDRIQSTISSDLDHLFGTTLISLTGGKGESEKSKLITDLTECLKTYDVLGLWRDAEDVLRREIVRPFIKKTIFSGALSAPHSPLLPHTPAPQGKTPAFISSALAPRTPYTPFTSRTALFHPLRSQGKGTSPYAYILDESEDPLAALYSQILRFVERELDGIMDIAEKVSLKSLSSRKPDKGGSLTPRSAIPMKTLDESESEETRGFDFLGNVIWEEFGRAIIDELGSSVFASGRPNEFKQHHDITRAFIRSLEFRAPSLHSIENMRRHPIYVAFENRWQLPVYFQIRWKEIVGKVEESLARGEVELINSSTTTFRSTQASDIWIAITACWSAEVFIPELSHRFWKLTLQLLSRYRRWLEETVIASHGTRPSGIVNEKIAASRSSTPVPTESNPNENAAADDAALRRCATVITDIQTMQKSTIALWNEEISMMLPSAHTGHDDGVSVELALRSAVDSLASLVTPLSKMIVSVLSRRACDALLPVRSIPSQLRAMSNKRSPSEASPFVATIMRPVKLFFGIIATGDSVGAPLKNEFLVQYSSEVFEEVSQKYVSYITAIKKAEDSLKRFKVSKKKTFSLFGSKDDENQESGDEERIRVQLVLDVEAFEKDGRALGIKLEESSSFKSLSELIKANEPTTVPEA